MPREVLKQAYETMPQSSHLIVDNILDIGQRSQVVRVVDRSPMAVVNRAGHPRMALPTFVNFPTSHAYREGGPGLVWDTCSQRLVEPNGDERKRAMGFPTGVTLVPSISKASRRQVLGQAMDLNCLTWIVNLGMVEQCRLKATFVVATPLWAKCEGEAHTPKSGNLESSRTPENSKLELKGQKTLHWGVLGVIGKVLKCRCLNWPRIGHLDICNPSYGQKKGRESNWQFDSRPLKVGNRPLPDVR